MAAKKSTSKKAAAKVEAENNRKRQASAIILFAIAIFLLCLAVIPGGSGWYYLHCGFCGLLGISAFILPVIMIYIAVLFSMDKPVGSLKKEIWLCGILITLFSAALEIFIMDIDGESYWGAIKFGYEQGTNLKNGGVLGAIVGYPLEAFLEDVGAKIVIALLVFVFFMLVTGTTLMSLFKAIGSPVKKAKDSIQSAFEEDEDAYEYEEEEEVITPSRRRRKIEIEEMDVTPSKRSIDIPMGEGYRTAETDLEDANKAAEKEMAEGLEETESALSIFKRKSRTKKETPAEEETTEPVIAEETPVESVAEEKPEEKPEEPTYKFPPLSLLKEFKPTKGGATDAKTLQQTADKIVRTLQEYRIETRVTDIVVGATVVRYELEPAAGVRVRRIAELADDISLRLATESVRIEAPIPGKSAVGIEVKKPSSNIIGLRELLEDQEILNSKSKLMVALGKDVSGNLVKVDIAEMPHLLVAGTTGSGKSVCTNSMILSILFRAAPDEVKLVLIDPKKVEFSVYNGIPHLLVPVVTDPQKAAGALGWAVIEMNKRYQEFSNHKVRDLTAYNEKAKKSEDMEVFPQILVVIDEFSDLMMNVGSEVEESVVRIAQMGRAAGIHMVIATQRPSANVITGLIKANIPSRIALSVSQALDSRLILDTNGAETLLGHGDMLFLPIGASKPLRLQGCYVSDAERENVIRYISPDEEQTYDEETMNEINRLAETGNNKTGASVDEDEENDVADEMLPKAIEAVIDTGEASVSLLQRKLRVGYARAGRLIDEMERKGIVGPHEGSKPRKVLLTREQWLEMSMNDEEV